MIMNAFFLDPSFLLIFCCEIEPRNKLGKTVFQYKLIYTKFAKVPLDTIKHIHCQVQNLRQNFMTCPYTLPYTYRKRKRELFHVKTQKEPAYLL